MGKFWKFVFYIGVDIYLTLALFQNKTLQQKLGMASEHDYGVKTASRYVLENFVLEVSIALIFTTFFAFSLVIIRYAHWKKDYFLDLFANHFLIIIMCKLALLGMTYLRHFVPFNPFFLLGLLPLFIIVLYILTKNVQYYYTHNIVFINQMISFGWATTYTLASFILLAFGWFKLFVRLG